MAYTKFKKNYTKSKYKQRCYSKPTVLGSSAFLARKALQGVKQLRGIINSELKKYDFGNSTGVTTASRIDALCALPQGDNVDQRSGNSILVKSLNVQGSITWTTNTTAGAVTLWIVEDTQQASDTTPNFSDIFNGQGVGSILNKATVGRYVIRKKMHFAQDNGVQFKFIDFHMSLNHHVRYNGAASTDIQKGGLYMVWVSNKTGVDAPLCQEVTRLSYYDN